MFYVAGDTIGRIFLAQNLTASRPRSSPEDILQDWAAIVDGSDWAPAPLPWPGTQFWPPAIEHRTQTTKGVPTAIES
jgi:hypothetical protein